MVKRFSSWVNRNMPTREQMGRNRFIQPWAHRVLASELWRFTRRSVPRGVALGMLVGIIVPFAQIIFAALLCLTVRANVPVAAVTTFVSNPFTTPFIWAFSYQVGRWILRVDAMIAGGPVDRLMQVTDLWQLVQWLTAEGKVLALGLTVVALISATVSYQVTSLAWGGWIRAKRGRRQASKQGDSIEGIR
jgi:uncharacterized protein (DUF2062 family)